MIKNFYQLFPDHLKLVVNIPLHIVPANLQEIKKWGKPVVAFCRSGARSGQAKRFLVDQGIECVNGGSWSNVARMTMG